MCDKIPVNPAFEKANSIIQARLANPNPSYLLGVTCGACGRSFYFDNLKAAPKIDEGVISDAHGEVRGFQFRFPCPGCQTLLRFDEDEIKTTAKAVPDAQHS
jgi:hypothetical protein